METSCKCGVYHYEYRRQAFGMTNCTTSCACSVASWTKTPIAPGEKGTVSATFDAKALGHFEKTVGIYSNAQPSLVYLKFVGEVVQEVTDFTRHILMLSVPFVWTGTNLPFRMPIVVKNRLLRLVS